MALRDLPVKPTFLGDACSKAYLTELTEIVTVEQLKVFVERWRPLVELKVPLIDMEQQLLDGKYDGNETLTCLKALVKGGECQHIKKGLCHGAIVAMPVVLLSACMAAVNSEVPTDVALIQLYGGVSALEPKRNVNE